MSTCPPGRTPGSRYPSPLATPDARAAFADLDHELAGTRRVLERVPDAHLGWAPQARSIGDVLAVGDGFVAVGMALRGRGRGAVLVFRPDAAGVWGPSHVVERAAEKSGELFGWAVAADGPSLVVGAPGIGPGRREDGRVFVYRGDGR